MSPAQQGYKEEEYVCIILTMPPLQFLKLTSQFLRLEIKIQPKEEEKKIIHHVLIYYSKQILC